MHEQTWRLLEEQFSEFPITRSSTPDPSLITEAEQQLGMTFHPDYAEFLRRYGAAIVGSLPIFGVENAIVLEGPQESVVEATKSFREHKWPGANVWYVISMDLAGNPIGIEEDGTVYISDHDAGGIYEHARNFEDFLLRHCLSPPR
jgi:hypothetical protein